MRTNGAQRPLLVLTLGSVAALAVLIGGSRLGGAQPTESCTPRVCSVLFPLHQDGRRQAGSGSAVVFHVPITLVSLYEGTARLMVGAHSISLRAGASGEAGGLSVRVQRIHESDATVIFALAPGGRRPGTTAR